MKELNFNTGIETFTVNGTVQISFNPTDMDFVERIFKAFNVLDNKQQSYRERIKRMADNREIFDFGRECDSEMRKIIDDLFGSVSNELFGNMNTYSLADGLPVWCNFMLAVIDEIDTSFAREQKATNPRLAKYLSRYKK